MRPGPRTRPIPGTLTQTERNGSGRIGAGALSSPRCNRTRRTFRWPKPFHPRIQARPRRVGKAAAQPAGGGRARRAHCRRGRRRRRRQAGPALATAERDAASADGHHQAGSWKISRRERKRRRDLRQQVHSRRRNGSRPDRSRAARRECRRRRQGRDRDRSGQVRPGDRARPDRLACRRPQRRLRCAAA